MFSAAKSGAASSGYNINNSLRFRGSATPYLNRTFTTPTNQKIWTWSGWIKLGNTPGGCFFGASNTVSNFAFIQINSSSQLRIADVQSSATNFDLNTTQVLRDPSAWYHIIVVMDTTQATASNRLKVYINGLQVTSFTSASYPALNATPYMNIASISHDIGTLPSILGNFDGYMAEVNFVDGQALTPSSFGSTNGATGVWQPAKYTGTYGTNGFYLKFSDIATTSGSNAGLGKDFSGNTNYWTTNNISVTAGTTYDAMLDVPTLTSATVANYAVMNPISNSTGTLSSANLKLGGTASGTVRCNSTMQVSSGKWYFEATLTTAGSYTTVGIGQGTITDQYPGQDALSYAQTLENASSINNNVQPSYGTALTTGDIFMCAFDLDNNKIFFGKNGTWFASSNPVTGANPAYTLTAGSYGVISRPYSSGAVVDFNFGQRAFSYTPPTGYVALNTYNLPSSTILQGNKYMDATLYTGNLTGQSITNAATFQPDLVWIKSRSAATDNKLTDSVRGATKASISNSDATETTDLTGLTAFNSNGFTLGASTTYNNTGATYVGWQWQAGQGTNTSNTSGSITSTVSVNTTAGFSVVTFTGTGANATVGHGLGVAPKMVIVKARTQGTGYNWVVYHASLGATQYLGLNNTNAAASASTVWNNTAPTSTVFSLGNDPAINGNTVTYLAYVWAEIAGFSKFGSYVGNGSADGPFVYTGFRPKYVLVKNITTTGQTWFIYDTSRSPYNLDTAYLQPNTSGAEAGSSVDNPLDILSNGFKIRYNNTGTNTSGDTYIYAAYAENPFKNANAR